jgi:hypothetical protein
MYAAPAEMLSRRARKSVQVLGMIRIRPMAPLDDRARCFALLSTCITARTHCSGTPKRFDASVTKAAKGPTDKSFGRRAASDSCSAFAAPLDSVD